MVSINKTAAETAANIAAGKKGFSLLEIVVTIIIIGLAMGAITESFIVGSAKTVNIVNEETAVNVAKGIMADLNYCRNGGTVAGVCSAFNNTGSPNCNGKSQNTWDCPSSFLTSPPQVPSPVNNECFYTTINASNVNFIDNGGNGNGTIQGSSNNYIQIIAKTGWFAENPPGSCPATAPANYPSVTLSTVYADY